MQTKNNTFKELKQPSIYNHGTLLVGYMTLVHPSSSFVAPCPPAPHLCLPSLLLFPSTCLPTTCPWHSFPLHTCACTPAACLHMADSFLCPCLSFATCSFLLHTLTAACFPLPVPPITPYLLWRLCLQLWNSHQCCVWPWRGRSNSSRLGWVGSLR